jgi:hypothetical protein
MLRLMKVRRVLLVLLALVAGACSASPSTGAVARHARAERIAGSSHAPATSGAAYCQGPGPVTPFALTVDGHVTEDGVHESGGDIVTASGRALHISAAPAAAHGRIDRLQAYVLPAGTQNDSTTFAQADTLALARGSASSDSPRQTVVLDDAKNLRPGMYALLVVMHAPTACDRNPTGAIIAMRQLRLRPSNS